MFNLIKIKLTIFLVLVGLGFQAQAAIPSRMTLTGKVTNIKHDVIGIQTEKGEINVPRHTIKVQKDIRPGKQVQARVTWQELQKVN